MQWSLENLKDTRLWLRAAYGLAILIALAFLGSWIFLALAFVWLIQTVLWLFTGRISEQLAVMTRMLLLSFYHYLEYLVYTTEQKPFPLDRLP